MSVFLQMMQLSRMDSLTPTVVSNALILAEMLRRVVASSTSSRHNCALSVVVLLLCITASSTGDQSPWRGEFVCVVANRHQTDVSSLVH